MGSFKVAERQKDDYYTFQLPEYFIVHNTITEDLIDGQGNTIGSFVVTPDGKVTMTFNEYVEDNPNIAGHLNIRTEFNEVKLQGLPKNKSHSLLKKKTLLLSLISSLK